MSSGGCRCGAHRLHRVWQYLWAHPSAKRKDAAKALNISLTNVWASVHQIKMRDPERLCPDCFKPEVYNGVCHACGAERDTPNVPLGIMGDYQSPTNNLHPGNELGTEVDYTSIGFVNHGMILKRRIERGIEDPLTIGVKSDVQNELKRLFPEESITNEAGRLCIKEVTEFRARYPGLARSKNVRKQLTENVMARMQLLHPQFRNLTPLAEVPKIE